MKIFCECLAEQLVKHPSMEPRDVVKLCYQAACGAEHLLEDAAAARAYFEDEYRTVLPKDEPLYEPISEGICRVNLAAWKQLGLPQEWLFRMFTGTVFSVDGKQRLLEYLDAAEQVLLSFGFDMVSWSAYLTEYKADGMPAVRHSEAYRRAEQPAYRIVNSAYLSVMPILSDIAEGENEACVIAAHENGSREHSLIERLKYVLGAEKEHKSC